MAARFCVLVLLFQAVLGQRNEGIIDHLSNGMKFAKDFLGSTRITYRAEGYGLSENLSEETCTHLAKLLKDINQVRGSESIAQKVAEFVVRAFQDANPGNRRKPFDDSEENFADENRPYHEVHEAPSPLAPLKNLVRLFGLQPNQISAVAVNALVFVAQMISTFLTGPKRPNHSYRFEDTTRWILNKDSRRLQDILATARNESLPDLLEDIIKEQTNSEETSCIRLLVCKITPFVTRMQKAVFGNETNGDVKTLGADSLYRHLPAAIEIEDRSAICERRHRDCDLNE